MVMHMNTINAVKNRLGIEEVHQGLLDDIKKMLFEIMAAFDRFTKEKQQNYKDEMARRRESTWR